MKKNYHTHTPRCRHALGSEEEYIKCAISRGLTTIGFSDHTPYLFNTGFVSGAKMLPEEAPEYFDVLLSLREKYKDKIDIKIGFETEYYPLFFDRLLKEYEKYPLEYIILGQHFVGNEGTLDAVSAFHPTSDRALLMRYTNQCIEALGTERFTYFAHPDCFNFIPKTKEDGEFVEFEYERMIRAAIETKTPLEINLCGVRSGRNYPNRRFWRLAGELSAEVVIGSDAHAPYQIAVEEELAFAKSLVEKYSLRLTENFPLKNPCF